MTGRLCELCGGDIKGKRADARFCSGSCRAKASQTRRDDGAEPVVAVRWSDPSPDTDAITARLDAIERLLANLGTDVATLREADDDGHVDVHAIINGANAAVVSRIERIEGSVRRQDAAIGKLDRGGAVAAAVVARVHALERAVAALVTGHAALRHEVESLATAIASALDTE